ncbi:MAG: ATP-binding cassette domain-containing protein, partial [Actinomycetota bacterium]
MSHLSFTDVAKNFGTTVALESFDLDVHEGELVSLLGPSGCGKTTALRIAAGFERSDRGQVRLAGEDLGPLPAHKRNMGMVFQTYSLFP